MEKYILVEEASAFYCKQLKYRNRSALIKDVGFPGSWRVNRPRDILKTSIGRGVASAIAPTVGLLEICGLRTRSFADADPQNISDRRTDGGWCMKAADWRESYSYWLISYYQVSKHETKVNSIYVTPKTVWNSLPPALLENMSLSTFKTKLKTHLLRQSRWPRRPPGAVVAFFRDFGAVI